VDVDSTPTGQGGAENNYYASLDPSYRAANRFFVSVTELRQVKGMTNEMYDYLEPLLIALPNAEGFNINTASVALMRSLNQKNVATPLSEEDAEMLISNRSAVTVTVIVDNSDLPEPPIAEAVESVDDLQDPEMLIINRSAVIARGGNSDLAGPSLIETHESVEAYESVEIFLTSNQASQIFGTDSAFLPSANGLRTGSEYFILTAKVSMLDYQRSQISIIKRESTADSVKIKVIRRTREQL
jgi:general secretion pathway protein K